MNYFKNKKGFTLIELIVTLAISGIFFTLALHMFGTANGAFANFSKTNDDYFKYNVKKATAEKMLHNNPGVCTNGIFSFIGDAADSLNKVFPFPTPQCTKIDSKSIFIYHLGKTDSTSNTVYGFSTKKF